MASMLGKRSSGGVLLYPQSKRNSSINRPFSAAARALIVKPYKKASKGKEGVFGGVVVSGTGKPELKMVDYNPAAVTPAFNSAYVASLTNGIAEGTALAQRIGSKITVKSIDVNWNIAFVQGATVTQASLPSAVDIILVWDKQPDGAVASSATIFANNATNLSYLLPANTERFVVLRRDRFEGSFNADNSYACQWHVPLDCDTKYPDATGSPNTNDFYICALSPSLAAATTVISPSLTFYSRVKFTDA